MPLAKISNEKPPATAIPAIATETGSPRSAPVATIPPTSKKANEIRARIIAPDKAATATTVTLMGRFMRSALKFTEHGQNQQN